MRVGNLLSQASRMSDVGLVWRLLLNSAATTQEVAKYSALYVKAKAACIVTLDGIDAVSLDIGDIITLNVGPGDPTDDKQTVKVEFSGSVICSVADEITRKK